MFKATLRKSKHDHDYHQRSKSDSGLSNHLIKLEPIQAKDVKQKKPLVFFEKFKKFLRSTENLQTTYDNERKKNSKQQQFQQQQLQLQQLQQQQLQQLQQQQKQQQHLQQLRNQSFQHDNKIKRPTELVAKIFKSFKSKKTQSVFYVDENSHKESTTDHKSAINAKFPFNENPHSITNYKYSSNNSTKEYPSKDKNISKDFYKDKHNSNHLNVLPDIFREHSLANQNSKKSKTFALIGSPKRKPRLQTPKTKAPPSDWDDGQCTLLLGIPGHNNNNMADAHAPHKRRRRKGKRLRNPRVRRRLVFLDEGMNEGHVMDDCGVLVCHFPVAV